MNILAHLIVSLGFLSLGACVAGSRSEVPPAPSNVKIEWSDPRPVIALGPGSKPLELQVHGDAEFLARHPALRRDLSWELQADNEEDPVRMGIQIHGRPRTSDDPSLLKLEVVRGEGNQRFLRSNQGDHGVKVGKGVRYRITACVAYPPEQTLTLDTAARSNPKLIAIR